MDGGGGGIGQQLTFTAGSTALVRGKSLHVLDDGALQRALWNITDGQGLTDEDRAAIAAL